LPEHLREQGYETAAFVSGWTLRGDICGLSQGFDTYDDRIPHRYKLVNRERYAGETNQAVQAYFESREGVDRPLFLFVHYFDPHNPYRKRAETWTRLHELSGTLNKNHPARTSEKILAYDSEIAYVDLQLGKLLALLRSHGILQNAIVLVLADHGESLGEHAYWGHGRRVYEQMLRIPLVIYAPRLFRQGRRIREPVCTLDILPTLIALADLPLFPGRKMEGRDLSGFLKGGTLPPGQRIYFETFKGTLKRFTKYVARDFPRSPLRMGFVQGNWKYILSPNGTSLEVYDLCRDPEERINLADRSGLPSVMSLLTTWYKTGIPSAQVRTRLSREEIAHMKSLGYID